MKELCKCAKILSHPGLLSSSKLKASVESPKDVSSLTQSLSSCLVLPTGKHLVWHPLLITITFSVFVTVAKYVKPLSFVKLACGR